MSVSIQTQNLSKHFRKVRAVDQLNLEVPEGSIFALVGPNGAGKTTAIKVLIYCSNERLESGPFLRV